MRIAISNLKGGVGKTTITQNLAVCFASMGYKVCIVDTDTNQNSLSWFGVRDGDLAALNVVGATDPKALNKTVDALHRDHDIVLIDGTPSLGEMTTRIILAADLLIIPILPSGHDFRSMQMFFERYELAKDTAGKHIPAYFLLNQYSDNIRVHQGIKGLLEQYQVPILQTTLRERVAYVATGIEGKGVLEHDDPKASDEMVALTKEILAIAAETGLVQS
jgi:chromosome partitioning protein